MDQPSHDPISSFYYSDLGTLEENHISYSVDSSCFALKSSNSPSQIVFSFADSRKATSKEFLSSFQKLRLPEEAAVYVLNVF